MNVADMLTESRRVMKVGSRQRADLRADIASTLNHPLRRTIRDILRIHGELTFTELASEVCEWTGINHQNSKISYHLNKIEEGGVVASHKTVIQGRQVTLYTLTDQYDEVFGEDVAPDLTALYGIMVVFFTLTVLSQLLPKLAVFLFSPGFIVIELVAGSVTSKVMVVEVFCGAGLFVTVVLAAVFNAWDWINSLLAKLKEMI